MIGRNADNNARDAALRQFGLCSSCEHQQIVKSGRGSVFSLCQLHKVDKRFNKYPRVPVGACPGFKQAADI